MHLRRALLLFAIVLGLAALATSISRPPRDSERDPAQPASPRATRAAPGPSSESPRAVPLPGARGRRSVRVEPAQASSLLVSVPEPGQVELPSFGLSSPADPLTPARFELLPDLPGTHEVRFTPAGGESRRFGRLVVR